VIRSCYCLFSCWLDGTEVNYKAVTNTQLTEHINHRSWDKSRAVGTAFHHTRSDLANVNSLNGKITH